MRNTLPLTFLLLAFSSCCNAQYPVLWGMTSTGGVYNAGVIFNYDIELGMYKKVYDFGAGNDGANPVGSLIQANNGLLYGMTSEGGVYKYNLGQSGGTIFSYDIKTGTETVLHNFDSTDGVWPQGSLIQASDGMLYGMTSLGSGNVGNNGVIFSYNIVSNTTTTVHSFTDPADGANPLGSLIQASNGLLYGTTRNAYSLGTGTIFSYNITNGEYTVVHHFGTGNDGTAPEGALVEVNNKLYGITGWGGTNHQGPEQDGSGVIYSYDISNGNYNIVYDFGKDSSDGTSGIGALMKANDGFLYGMTRDGGNLSISEGTLGGTIFSFNPATDTETVLHSFGIKNDGITPTGSPIQAINGPLFGMTSAGGVNVDLGQGAIRVGGGMIYMYDPSTGSYTNLHNFYLPDEGSTPLGNLLEIDTPILLPKSRISQLPVYPNPSTGQFTIVLPDAQSTYPIEVYDMLGQKIEQQGLSAYQNTISLTNQPAGMYFVDVQTENGRWSAKVVVER